VSPNAYVARSRHLKCMPSHDLLCKVGCAATGFARFARFCAASHAAVREYTGWKCGQVQSWDGAANMIFGRCEDIES
jgi:hypothetical protein